MEGMEASYRGKLRLWDEYAPLAVQEFPESNQAARLAPAAPREFADWLYAHEALSPAAPQPARDEAVQPYTLQWFLNIENQRHSRQGRWIPRLLEFAKHPGETLLGLGDGLGTDWLQYARYGAEVIVCSPSAEQLGLIRRNFELRGLGGRFLHARSNNLPLESNTIDVVCMSNIEREVADPSPVVEEVYRVLKPGGKVLAVLPARFDIDFWFYCCFPWLLWSSRRPSSTAPTVVQFSRRQLRRLFSRFVDHRIHRRQLRRSEIPHIWRWMPRPFLERLMGRLLILKAFKPVSAVIEAKSAA
jgi:ubiquinone/menaquinone biosynthesis C-methylase UbiE